MSGPELRPIVHSPRPQFLQRLLQQGRALAACCACFLLAAAGSTASAQGWLPVPQGATPFNRDPAGHLVTKTAHPAVARIVAQEKDGVSYGSGSLVDVRGDHALIVTNWHVIRDATPNGIYVFFTDGFQSPATVVKADRDWDLAALSIRKPPSAQPIALATQAPRAGEWLCIAGYGSGDYRAAAGRCTQYVSPATHLPFEMVELAAEARQGDSGGPIFNERGELAGVLFGSARGTTSGSYSGRVMAFLQGVVPVDVPAGTIPHAASLANQQPPLPAQAAPAADAHLFAAAGPLLPSAKMEAESSESLRAEITPVEVPPRPLMPLPERSAAPLSLVASEEPIGEDRTALRPTTPGRGNDDLEGRELAMNSRTGGPLAAEALTITHTTLPPRFPTTSPLETAPADQLLAAAWKQVGGSTLFDQGKTLLAVLGLLGLLIQFWRMNSRPEVLGDDD